MNRTMRLLRHKHNISYVELSKAAEISTQRISQIELNPGSSTRYHRELMRRAFLRVIAARKLALFSLEQDFARYQNSLLDEAPKEEDQETTEQRASWLETRCTALGISAFMERCTFP